MSRNNIQFVSNETKTTEPSVAPQRQEGSGFNRLWLSEDYSKLVLKLKEGDNLVRFIPPVKGTTYSSFVLPLLVAKIDNTEFVTAIGDQAVGIANRQTRDTSPLATAYWYLYKNAKGSLYNARENPNGFRLRPKQVGVSWVITFDEERKPIVRLLSASLYSGDKGTKGVLGEVLLKSREEDIDPVTGEKTPKFGDISDPETGNFVNIKKIKDHNIADPIKSVSYQTTISSKASPPLSELLGKVSDEEIDFIQPLDNIINVASDEQQKIILKEYLGEYYKDIFNTATREQETNTR